jgi:hypothetical protein
VASRRKPCKSLLLGQLAVNEETPSGSGTTHTVHAIAIHELHKDESTVALYVEVPKSKARSIKLKLP